MNHNDHGHITERTLQLLDNEEGYDVDFKRSIAGVHSEDLVAFANSKAGGAILVGVDETTDVKGQQRGVIVGCEVTDQSKLNIINKAQSCRPPVELEVITEDAKGRPFYRIEIPSGTSKPYCTNKGEYMVRHDGRNVALTPDRLLQVYLDQQSHVFIKRFKDATLELTKELEDTKQQITELNQEIYSIKTKVADEVREMIEHIMDSQRKD